MEEVIEKLLESRDSKEKNSQNRRKNIILNQRRQMQQMKKSRNLQECKNICKVNSIEESLEKAIRLEKVNQSIT